MDQSTEQEVSQTEEFLPGISSVAEFSTEGIKKVMAATRAFQSLPASGPAWDLHKSYPAFNRAMRNSRSKLVPMISSLLKHANIPTDDFRAGDTDEKFDFLVEANDDMLERVGRALDEASGLFKKAETISINPTSAASSLKPPGTWGKRKALDEQGPFPENSSKNDGEPEPKLSNRQIRKSTSVFNNRIVREKPQVKFKTAVDNSLSPFVPKLKEKPNSIKPLSILPEYNSKNEEFFGHPYLVELNRWEPIDTMLTEVTPQMPKRVEDTPLVEVKTTRDVEQLLRDLYEVNELAIDLEHHSYRSFLGFTCLMQISTREKDYIIDTLALREHLYHLNEIFTNPKVVKVLHGSNMDIEWLQKDFGLYIVNMFDTQIAAKQLGFQQLGLQPVLEHYCGVNQNKTFQMADWRIRPLPKEMIQYARQDTHFLLYVYDKMKNALIESGNQHNNLLLSVYDLSKMICLKRYEKPGNNPKLALRKMRRTLNNRQLYAFTELYKWRDATAREKDESIAYVLPNHMLLMIAEQLPKEMTGILACCDPVPPLLHANLGALHKIVTNARELPLQEHTSEEKTEKRQKLKDWVILMNSVHDVSLSEVAKLTDDKQSDTEEDPSETTENSEISRAIKDILSVSLWPLPLKEPTESHNIKVLQRPSIQFNRKISKAKTTSMKPSQSTTSIKSESTVYNFEVATTAFERYQLSKEIIDMMKDPVKKNALDMENPVVRAVYETVFCDPADDDEGDEEEKPQKLEKVFTEGEFIPFNPLADGAKSKPSKKRKREHNDWDDVKQQPTATAKDETAIPFKVDDVSDPEMTIEDENDNSGSTSKLSQFMALSTEKTDSGGKAGKNKKKKKKGMNFLKKVKNPFSKKKDKANKVQQNHESAETIAQPQPQQSPSNSDNRRRSSRNLPTSSATKQNNRIDNRQDQSHSKSGSPNNRRGRALESESTPGAGRNNRGGGRSRHGTPQDHHQEESPRNSGGGRGRGGRGSRGQNKRGKFFNFRNRDGGSKSMTFK